jgi:hypothetical protein
VSIDNETPFATDTYLVDGHVIEIASYHDGQVDAYRQRNGSGAYNAKKYTRWVVTVGEHVWTYQSRFGRTKWEAYEVARQLAAPTADAHPVRDPATRRVVGQTRGYSVVKAEMAATKVGAR